MRFSDFTKTICFLTSCTALTGCLQPPAPQDATPTVTPTVTPTAAPNVAPSITNTITNITIGEGEALILTIDATDPEKDQLRYEADNLPDWATLDKITGAITGTATVNSKGAYSNVILYVHDSANTTKYGPLTITVKPNTPVPPTLFNSRRNQPLSAGTVSTDLQVSTDKPASCRYSTTAGIDYNDMLSVFDNTGQATTHTTQVTSLTDGSSYTYYVRCNDSDNNSNQADYSINIDVLSSLAKGTPWSYPAIPYTDWAYNPFTIELQKPAEWPSAPATNYYYVEPENPLASDVIQNDELSGDFGRFGYPERPRKSIPSKNWKGDIYTAGTVVWLKGGTYTKSEFHNVNYWSPQFHGTEEQPVWFYGDPTDKPSLFGVAIRMYNSQHLIMENIQWMGGNKSNGAISLTRADKTGSTHHITLRNLRFENLNYTTGNGAIVGLAATSPDGANVHDIVAYKNIFKNNGGGFDWMTKDGDQHGYKIDAVKDGNEAYRIWIIDNKALAGDTPHAVDGLRKSLSGNLVQAGDEHSVFGGVHHIYVAGNYQEHARQALGWTKRSNDVIFSTNYCTDTVDGYGSNGQCYGHQYEGDYNWWINNTSTRSSSGWMHTSNNRMHGGKLFVVGNLFYGNKNTEQTKLWRTCSGVSMYTQRGEHYIVNNLFDNNCYGIWAETNRSSSTDHLHIYNNIFTNHSGKIDLGSKAIALDNSNDLQIFMENNLFGSYDDSVSVNRRAINTLTDLNDLPWASMNIEGDPLYIDVKNENYDTMKGSAAANKGALTYDSGAEDVYQQFINRYTNDPNYPGDPINYWPKDSGNSPRVSHDTIDIGPYEQQK